MCAATFFLAREWLRPFFGHGTRISPWRKLQCGGAMTEQHQPGEETSTRAIVVVLVAILLSGAAGWFLHQAASVFDKKPAASVTAEAAEQRAALAREREKSQRLERQLA